MSWCNYDSLFQSQLRFYFSGKMLPPSLDDVSPRVTRPSGTLHFVSHVCLFEEFNEEMILTSERIGTGLREQTR